MPNIIPVSEAKSILNYSLTKPDLLSNYAESDTIKGSKTTISRDNLSLFCNIK